MTGSKLKIVFDACHFDPAGAVPQTRHRSEKTSNARFLVARRGDLLRMIRPGGEEFFDELLWIE